MATIICSQCQAEDTVPFEPKEGRTFLCKQCFQQQKAERTQKAMRHIPRKKHGTRVSFLITCARCGVNENLDYVPKGTSLDEVLCSTCAQRRFGLDSKWAKVVSEKASEKQTLWDYQCAECDTVERLSTPPKKGRDYLCQRCFYEHEDPSHERLEGKEKLAGNVFIRKRTKD